MQLIRGIDEDERRDVGIFSVTLPQMSAVISNGEEFALFLRGLFVMSFAKHLRSHPSLFTLTRRYAPFFVE